MPERVALTPLGVGPSAGDGSAALATVSTQPPARVSGEAPALRVD